LQEYLCEDEEYEGIIFFENETNVCLKFSKN